MFGKLKTSIHEFNLVKKEFGDSLIDISDPRVLRDFNWFGKKRLLYILLPFYALYSYAKAFIEYEESLSNAIRAIERSNNLKRLIEIYQIKIKKQYGLLVFESEYSIPDEYKEADLPEGRLQQLIVDDFSRTTMAMIDDVADSEFADLVNIEGVENTNRLRLVLEPVGYYECTAFKNMIATMLIGSCLTITAILASILIFV